MHCFCHIAVLALKFISPLVIHARLLGAAFLESYTTVCIVKEVMKRGNLSQKSSEDKKSVIHKTKSEHNKIWFSYMKLSIKNPGSFSLVNYQIRLFLESRIC